MSNISESVKAAAQPKGKGKGGGGGGAHCFLRGTKILALQGERSIEDLRIGNPVSTVSGGNWLSIDKQNGSARVGDVGVPVKVSINPTGLAAGALARRS